MLKKAGKLSSVFFVILILLSIIKISDLVHGQDSSLSERPENFAAPQQDSTQNSDFNKIQNPTKDDTKKQVSDLQDIGSFWNLMRLGGTLRWPIYGVFMLGILLIIHKIVELVADEIRSHALLNANISLMSLEEINETIDKSPSNIIKTLFQMLMEIFETTGQTSIFHEEVVNFVQYQQDRFRTFATRLSFLSDTAGALGLLGTVWGMFETFFGGNMDKQVILDGMGIALVTTLMGLVVSIILNFFGTEIFSFFNKRLEKLQIKADEFRIRISKIEKSKQKRYELEKRFLEQEMEVSQNSTSEVTSSAQKRVTVGPPFKLVYVAGDAQAAQVNSRLKNPFVVELLDAYDNRLSGQLVRFAVEKGEGNLSNGGKVQEILTDSDGRAITYLTTGMQAGENLVRASARSLNGQYIEFVAHGEASSPASMTLISGNNLAGPSGSLLTEPFVIEVKDGFMNPIPDFQVLFKVTMGNGYFTGKTNKYEVVTDANGQAQAYFTLGTKKGFNRVVVTSKKLRRTKIEIQTLGQ